MRQAVRLVRWDAGTLRHWHRSRPAPDMQTALRRCYRHRLGRGDDSSTSRRRQAVCVQHTSCGGTRPRAAKLRDPTPAVAMAPATTGPAAPRFPGRRHSRPSGVRKQGRFGTELVAPQTLKQRQARRVPGLQGVVRLQPRTAGGCRATWSWAARGGVAEVMVRPRLLAGAAAAELQPDQRVKFLVDPGDLGQG